jgi:hypothetical protein
MDRWPSGLRLRPFLAFVGGFPGARSQQADSANERCQSLPHFVGCRDAQDRKAGCEHALEGMNEREPRLS